MGVWWDRTVALSRGWAQPLGGTWQWPRTILVITAGIRMLLESGGWSPGIAAKCPAAHGPGPTVKYAAPNAGAQDEKPWTGSGAIFQEPYFYFRVGFFFFFFCFFFWLWAIIFYRIFQIKMWKIFLKYFIHFFIIVFLYICFIEPGIHTSLASSFLFTENFL